MAHAARNRRISLRIGAKRLRIRIGIEALMPPAGERCRVKRRRVAAERLRKWRWQEPLALRQGGRVAGERKGEPERQARKPSPPPQFGRQSRHGM